MSLSNSLFFVEGDLAAGHLPPTVAPPPGLSATLPQKAVLGETSKLWQQHQQQQQQQWQQLLAMASATAPPPGLPLPPSSPAAAMVLRPPPGLPPPPAPPAATAPQPATLDLALAFMAGASFARAGMTLGGPPASSSASCGQSSETCSTADTTEEPPSPQITPVAAAPCLSMHHSAAEAELLAQDSPETPVFLDLSAAIGSPPGLSLVECPTVGSADHHLGLCKPCDFVGRGFDCRMGADCKFCHLCGPAERKMRKAQRRKMVRATAHSGAALQSA